MVVHLFLNNNKALDFLPINSIKNGGITVEFQLTAARRRLAPLPNKRAGELKIDAESNRRAFALAGIGNSSIA